MDTVLFSLADGALAPTRATAGAVGYDLYAYSEHRLMPGDTVKVRTGVTLLLPSDCRIEAQVRARGSVSFQGLILVNGIGTVDPDYRGEILVPVHFLYSPHSKVFTVAKGDRIAQLVFASFVTPNLVPTDSTDPTPRGSGAFGSTGR